MKGIQLGRIALILALLWTPLAAQYRALTSDDAARQEAAILSERRVFFQRTWLAASPERRGIVQKLFERHARASSALCDQPDRSLLALGTRILLGADGARVQNDPLVALVDNIDVFSAPVDLRADRSPAEGQVITVGVRFLERVQAAGFPAGALRLHLMWEGPDGELLMAKESAFEREAANQGMALALRTPPKARGTWSLVPSLSQAGVRVQGWPVPVPMITDFAARCARIQSSGRLLPGLVHVLKWGRIWVRRSDRLGPGGWLDFLEGSLQADGPLGPDVLVTRPAPERPLVLLVAAPGETAAGLLVGPVGAAWERLADALDVHLAAAPAKQLVGRDLERTLASLRSVSGASQVILVARGRAAVSINLSLPLVDAGLIQGLVLVNAFGAPAPGIAPMPTLLVGCGGVSANDGAQVSRSPAPRTLLLADSVLPQAFEVWFREAWPEIEKAPR